MRTKYLFAVLCALPVLAWADNCDRTRNTFDDIYCTNKIYANADAELNQNYQRLQKKLNANQKNLLKRSQIRWIRQRDTQCDTSDESSQSVNVDCRLRQTQERNHWLRERLRECQAVGCKTSMLDH